tara:strand:+ start:9034 stop:9288 length:255 start_codon:yes stop_codon:yes gene_type:complete
LYLADVAIEKDTKDLTGMASAQVIGVTNVTGLIATNSRGKGMRHRNMMALEKDYQTTIKYKLWRKKSLLINKKHHQIRWFFFVL